MKYLNSLSSCYPLSILKYSFGQKYPLSQTNIFLASLASDTEKARRKYGETLAKQRANSILQILSYPKKVDLFNK